jgi:hypothetical protein
MAPTFTDLIWIAIFNWDNDMVWCTYADSLVQVLLAYSIVIMIHFGG